MLTWRTELNDGVLEHIAQDGGDLYIVSRDNTVTPIWDTYVYWGPLDDPREHFLGEFKELSKAKLAAEQAARWSAREIT